MRRNLTSLLKFMCLCFVTVLLTAFLYKSIFQRINDDMHPHQGAFFSGSAKNLQQKKIDWHDYRYMEWEKSRVGIGEHGKAAHTLPEEEHEQRRVFRRNGFNGLLSMFIVYI